MFRSAQSAGPCGDCWRGHCSSGGCRTAGHPARLSLHSLTQRCSCFRRLPGYNLDLSIAGKFGLVIGYGEEVTPTAHIPTLVPHAEFVDVHAILFNPLSAAPLPVPGWDLDKTLNLSGLNGTFSDPSLLHFTGADGQGTPIKLDASLRGPLLHLTGTNFLPPTCAGCAIRRL